MRFALILIIIVFQSLSQAEAISFKDEDLKNGTVLEPIKLLEHVETHFDTILNNDWTGARADPQPNKHRAFLDYRVESHLPLYNLFNQRGRLVTRVQGAGFIDDRIGNFFDDPLIDIPELFLENKTQIKDNDVDLIFGKFANRRFFNKDEINSDPFDIGEMRFSGAIANSLNLLNRINEFRDDDLREFGSRQASGSYGFKLGIKNKATDGKILSRWGFNQAFAFKKLEHAGRNFYGISELNKNWGELRPGKFSLGLVYANDEVYNSPRDGGMAKLVYSSIAQKLTDRIKVYLRYGTLLSTLSANNEYRAGVYYKWNKHISTHNWIGLFDGEKGLAQNDNFIQWTNVLTYKITDNFFANAAAIFRFNRLNNNTFEDNNYSLAVHLRYFR